jgi:ubiquinone biosynthesis protein Coq4
MIVLKAGARALGNVHASELSEEDVEHIHVHKEYVLNMMYIWQHWQLRVGRNTAI